MKWWMLVTIVCLAFCTTAAKEGCGGAADDDEELTNEMKALAEDAGDTTGAADTATSIVSIPVLPLSAAKVATADGAATAATNVGLWFKPAGCINATSSGATVTYVFSGCSGPFGLVGINGKLTGTFALTANGVTIDVKSEGLTLNKTSVEQSAKVTVTWSGAVRTVTWDGGYKGQTSRHKLPIEHTASYTTELNVATGCVKWNGSGSTTIASRGLSVNVTGYQRCGTVWKCPSSGSITATGQASGLKITLEYLGGGKARLTGPGGRSWDYTMLWCFP